MENQTKSLSAVFENLNNLKSAFKIGEKIVPIIQNLTEFMQEIAPLLSQINSSIIESAGQMPQAKDQIESVTSATELATTEILDLVDEITAQVNNVESTLSGLQEKQKTQTELLNNLKSVIKGNSEAEKIINDLEVCNDFYDDLVVMKDKVSKVSEDSFKITMSLQVQDITSQQLAAVNHLIESVNDKLSGLVDQINNSDIQEEFKNLAIEVKMESSEETESTTFDSKAKYDHDEKRQKKVDDIIKSGEQASQDDIDKLFA